VQPSNPQKGPLKGLMLMVFEEKRRVLDPVNMFGMLPNSQSLLLLYGASKVGKTAFSIMAADRFAQSEKVLFIDLEGSAKQHQLRYTNLEGNLKTFSENLFRAEPKTQLNSPNQVEDFLEAIEGQADLFGLIFIDSLSSLLTNSGKVIERLNTIKQRKGCSFFITGHFPKDIARKESQFRKQTRADQVWSINYSTKGSGFRYLKKYKGPEAGNLVTLDCPDCPTWTGFGQGFGQPKI
jgi:hypothetical protein